MTFSLNFLQGLVFSYVLIFARVGTIFMTLPGYGELFFPARLRLSLALAVTFIMLPLLSKALPVLPADFAGLLILLIREILYGVFIGFVIRFVQTSMQTAGALIAQQIGVGFVTQIDPTQGGQGLIIGNFLALLGVVLVFATDLHHLALAAIHDSYTLFPPSTTFEIGGFSQSGLAVFTQSFALAVQMAAPFLVAGLVFQVAIGVLSRLMPQLQIFFIALPVQIIAGFLLFAVLLVTMAGWYLSHVESTYHLFMVK